MPTEVPAGVTPTYAQQYRRCGKTTCPLCAGGGRGHGPYWYAYWREDGRTRSHYLGKLPPPGVADGTRPPAPPEDAVVAPIGEPAGPPLGRRAAAPGALPLRARTLGGFALWRGGERLATERWERRREGALLKWLLSAPGRRLAGDEVVERFWPEGDPEQGTANVRVLVHRLRKELGEAAGEGGTLRYDGEVLSLVPDGVAEAGWLDADAFARAARAALAGRDAAACRGALARYTGDYLPGDAYEEWALARREDLRGQRVALLLHLARLCAAGEEIEEAERCLQTILSLDPCHEHAALTLMRLYAGAGRPGKALRVYRRLAEALREELGLAPEEDVQALARDLVAQQPAAPAVPVPDALPNNLPAPLTSFIGRRRELAALRILLRPARAAAEDEPVPCRLLTLTGPGGVGKTRLALRLADDLLDEPESFPDGVWLTELASLADSTLVARAVALALGIREEGACPLAATLAAHLKTRQLLLLLDNCEHLLDACADLLAALLPACPGLRVVATSRAPLGLAGERPWPVPALSLPDPRGSGQAGLLLESEAARLFLERARVQRPDLALMEDNAGVVARICRQLDGIPLAIELAAARVGVLGLGQIADRLHASLGLLTGGPRTAPQRQRTLRATLDWSYHLLGAQEQAVLRRLSVFAGGCTLDGATAVCGDPLPPNPSPTAPTSRSTELSGGACLPAGAVLDLLGQLVSKSLVSMSEGGGTARYGLLETMREYGRERLAADGEATAVARRHALHYLALAEAAEAALTGSEQAAWYARLEQEHDNLRAALRWCCEHGEQELGLRLAGALWRFWFVQGHLSDGREWLEARLAAGGGDGAVVAPAVRAKALHGAGRFAWSRGDHEQATRYYQACLDLCRQLGDSYGVATALNGLGLVAHDQTDYGRATSFYEQSVALFEEIGELGLVANGLNNLALVACERGALERAALLAERSLATWQGTGEKRGRGVALAYNTLGCVKREQGDREQASALLRESLILCRELGDKEGIAENLEALAAVAALDSRPERAVALLGAAEALREAIGAPLPLNERAVRDRSQATARGGLDDHVFDRAWSRGRALTLEDALHLALGDASTP